MKTLLFTTLLSACILSVGVMAGQLGAAPVPQRTSYSGLNSTNREQTYRHRKFGSYMSIEAFSKRAKVGRYSSCENATGIFFRKGEEVCLTLSREAQGKGIKLLIANYANGLSLSEYPLHEGENIFTIDKEGLGYIDYRYESKPSEPVTVDIRGGEINGIFTLEDDQSTWKRLLHDAKYMVLDMVGERVQLVMNLQELRKGCPNDGPKLLRMYDEIIRIEQEDILGWHLDGTHTGNHVMGRSMPGGYMHADGFGAAFHDSTIAHISNPDKLRESSWGVAHEFGHVNQTRPGMCWSGTTEVTNNICSAWVAYNFAHEKLRDYWEWENNDNVRMRGGVYDNYLNNALVARRTWLWYGGPKGSDETLDKRAGWVMETLLPLWQLQLYYAVAQGKKDFYPRIYHDVRVTDESKMTLGEIQLLFFKRACDAAGENLSEFFVKLGIVTPMYRVANDYTRGLIDISFDMCEEALRYASKYPKPASRVIYYISARNEDIFRERRPLTPGTRKVTMQDGLLEVPADAWHNAVAYEAYRGNTLLHISPSGLNHEDDAATSVVCPNGTDKVKAVQWDGKRVVIWSKS